jgi:hypothetical protein
VTGASNDKPAPEPIPVDLDAPGTYELPLCLADLKLFLGEDIAAIQATTLERAVIRLPFAKDGLNVLGDLIAVARVEEHLSPDRPKGPLS